jgi:O-methyltransferase domain/Dimerisation domain
MKTPPRQEVLMHMVAGFWMSRAICLAAKLGLADLVKDGPKSSAELAQATSTHAPSLYRLLRMLASVGIFAEDDKANFSITPLAECIIDAPGSQRAAAMMFGEVHYRCWGELEYSVRTGKTAFEHIHGEPIFEFLSKNPDQAKIFDGAMAGVHAPEARAMVDAYDFSDVGTLVELGGGNGSAMTVILKRHPSLRAILYDLPGVIGRSKDNIAKAGLADRCQTIGGSFFDAVPPGGDAYLMRHVIHDWNDEQAVTILRNCRKGLAAGARLLVVENVVPAGNEPSFTKQLDVNMMVVLGGKERTEVEYRALYEAAGFRLTRVVPTAMNISVVEGKPA